MNILGIETSCDETAAAVVADGTHILSNVVATQIDLHARYGGVVPEVAARSHIEVMLPVVEHAIAEAFGGKSNEPGVMGSERARRSYYPLPITHYWDKIDGIAVTAGPGLLGSLLIGTLTAASLAETKHKPLYAVNHVEAHVYANFLEERQATSDERLEPKPDASNLQLEAQFPLLALIVSGGHSQFVLFRDHLDYQVLGQTRDDAAGEAFDKIAKLLGLGFPGGPAIAKAALNGDDRAFNFPMAQIAKDSLDYSFSGLKTAVLRQAQKLAGGDHTLPSAEVAGKLSDQQKFDLAASFQKTVVDTLVDRFVYGCQQHQPKSVAIAGGVAANQLLRDELTRRLPLPIHFAPHHLMTDNAAMVAALGYHLAQAGRTTDPHQLRADSALAM